MSVAWSGVRAVVLASHHGRRVLAAAKEPVSLPVVEAAAMVSTVVGVDVAVVPVMLPVVVPVVVPAMAIARVVAGDAVWWMGRRFARGSAIDRWRWACEQAF